MNTKKWTTLEGRKIRIKDMDDQHLRNTIKMLDRNFPRARDAQAFQMLEGAAMMNGEMAIECLERESDRLMDSTDPSDVWPIYTDLVDEANRRGIEL